MITDELHGADEQDYILGDFGVIVFDESLPNLYGILSIDSLNCTDGGGINVISG